VDRHSRAGVPPEVALISVPGKKRLRVLDANPAPRWARLSASVRSRFVTVPAADGTPLNGRLFLPPRASARTAAHASAHAAAAVPGLIYVYGGPHGHVVANRWHRMEPWHVFFAQRGFAVLLVDGRGTAYRGKTFEAQLWRRFGVVDVADVAAAARWLGRQPGVDPHRIGLWGWSYGGFLTVMTALKTGALLRAAAAVAPVTDWSLYDTAYTERYLGLPKQDAATYTQASPLPLADRLQIPLLLVHGMSDDNVLLTHTLKLAQALQRKTRLFTMMLYPGKAHSIKGTAARRHLMATLLAHFQQHLRP
jgi:dipeptidyl-peptidase-4